MDREYDSFREFWPDYVRQHLDPTNRAVHLVGTGLAVLMAARGIAKRRPLLVLAAPLVGYLVAGSGHLLFEKNRPGILRHPLYSLVGNFVMVGLMIRGRMGMEVERIRATDDATRKTSHAAPS
jgi:hypothetical protein